MFSDEMKSFASNGTLCFKTILCHEVIRARVQVSSLPNLVAFARGTFTTKEERSHSRHKANSGNTDAMMVEEPNESECTVSKCHFELYFNEVARCL